MTGNLEAEFGRLCDDERAALMAGRLGALADIVKRRLALTERLAAAPNGEIETLRRLAAQASANQRLIEAALSGVRSARIRVRTIRAAARGLTAYGADGTAHPLAVNPPSVERRS